MVSAEGARIRLKAEEAAAPFPPLLVEARRIANTVAAGVHGRRRAGPGETFWQHRAYAFGDPVSSIDWRQSARAADRLYVRQNEWEAAAGVRIWRDSSRSLDYASDKSLPTKRFRADVLTMALVILLAEAGERVGLLGQQRRPFHGRAAPPLFLEALLAEKTAVGSAPPKAHVAHGTQVVLVSDFLIEPAAVVDAVKSFAADGASGALVQIADPAEEDFPFAGRTEFLDPESNARELFGEAAAVAKRYREKYGAHGRAIADAARRFGFSFLVHRTDKPPQTALLALFLALGDVSRF
jgi:uncharacterized protein (DUF58 family)